MPEADGVVQAVFRLGDVMDAVGRLAPVGLADLTHETGLPKTTVHRFLGSLEAARMVIRTDSGYALGPRVAQWRAPLDQFQTSQATIRTILRGLAEETGETASIFVGLRDRRVCRAVQEGPQEVRHVLKADQVFPLGVGAGGKLLLSLLTHSERPRALDATRERFPGVYLPTLADTDLDGMRDAGFATSMEEREAGLASVAVVIPAWPSTCFSLSGPANRFGEDRQKQFVRRLKIAAEQLQPLLAASLEGGDAY